MRLIEQFKAIFFGSDNSANDQWLHPDPRLARARFIHTHRHVATGGYYRVTGVGRLEVTGDEAYPLVEYENEAGERFAQRYDRFFDGRFEGVLL